MTTTHANEHEAAHGGLDVPSALLWATAILVGALALTQASKLSTGPMSAAEAGNVSSVGDLRILTAEGGDREDVLVIIDERSETLFVYGVLNAQEVQLHQKQNLSELFTQARAAVGLGGRRR